MECCGKPLTHREALLQQSCLVFPAVQPMWLSGFQSEEVLNKLTAEQLRHLTPFLSGGAIERLNYALFSAGNSTFDIPRSREKVPMLWQRECDLVLMADSGGFQVAKGANGWGISEYQSNRARILAWQEAISDIAISMDVPTWGVGKNPEFPDVATCLAYNIQNLHFTIANRVPRRVRILNSIQGGEAHCGEWLNAVAQFNSVDAYGDAALEGWAFGGGLFQTPESISELIAHMKENNLLGGRNNWIHVLGTTAVKNVIMLSQLQSDLRSELGDRFFTISCDSSSPNQTDEFGKMYGSEHLKRGRAVEVTHEYNGETKAVSETNFQTKIRAIPQPNRAWMEPKRGVKSGRLGGVLNLIRDDELYVVGNIHNLDDLPRWSAIANDADVMMSLRDIVLTLAEDQDRAPQKHGRLNALGRLVCGLISLDAHRRMLRSRLAEAGFAL